MNVLRRHPQADSALHEEASAAQGCFEVLTLTCACLIHRLGGPFPMHGMPSAPCLQVISSQRSEVCCMEHVPEYSAWPQGRLRPKGRRMPVCSCKHVLHQVFQVNTVLSACTERAQHRTVWKTTYYAQVSSIHQFEAVISSLTEVPEGLCQSLQGVSGCFPRTGCSFSSRYSRGFPSVA